VIQRQDQGFPIAKDPPHPQLLAQAGDDHESAPFVDSQESFSAGAANAMSIVPFPVGRAFARIRVQRGCAMDFRDIQAWRSRWIAVSARREREVRRMSATEKARQVSLMMQTRLSSDAMRKREAEVEEIRRRWMKLREFYGHPE
jgi:hypothetical protein